MRLFNRLRGQMAWIGPAGIGAVTALSLLGLVLGWSSWSVAGVRDLERWLFDLRATPSVELAQQQPVTLVTYTDETLAALGKRSPLDRRTLANALRILDQHGAKAIGIDIVIDAPDDGDEELIQVLRSLRTPVYLAYESPTDATTVITSDQAAYQDQFFARFAGNPAIHKASVAIDADPDGVVRRWPSRGAGTPPLLPVAMLGGVGAPLETYSGAVVYRTPASPDQTLFGQVPIELFGLPRESGVPQVDSPEMLSALRPLVQDRYVLIGADLRDIDRFATPLSAQSATSTSGLELNAVMLVQALNHELVPTFPDWAFAIAPVLLLALGLATGAASGWRRVLLAASSVALIVAAPIALERLTTMSYGVPAIGWLVTWLSGFCASVLIVRTAAWQQGRMARTALQRYLPPDVAEEILATPRGLDLVGAKKNIFVLFSDLEGFTGLCHRLPADQVATLLNEYLERLGQMVLSHGGTIDKFVGDAVVAFWGAPIAKADDGDRAIQAALAIHQEGERFRSEKAAQGIAVGRTRVGLHFGEAIVGNFGGEGRIQYTALGDSMNVAARLESANKELGTSVLVSKAAADGTSARFFRSLGLITVRGRETAIEVTEPTPSMPQTEVDAANRLVAAAITGDQQAMDQLDGLAAARPDDAALKALIGRIRAAKPGEVIVAS
jgi:adenylate cyclase